MATVTEASSKSQSSRVGAQAFEFWTTLIQEEFKRKQKNQAINNYIAQVKPNLITLILSGLLVINFDQDEDADEWGHSLAAACCL